MTDVHYVPATLRQDLMIFSRDGNKLGKVSEVMVDLARGRVDFAIVSFGGFLGLGQKYHPLPFGLLDYREDKGGYVVSAEPALIDGSPAYRVDDAPVFDASYGDRLYSYYGVTRPGSNAVEANRATDFTAGSV
ncbi:MAG: PRC-barrel domain-containing protein [Chakrabartia godavariana]